MARPLALPHSWPAGRPQPAARLSGLALQGNELIDMGDVGREGGDLGITVPDESRVDEQPIRDSVDVRQRAPVSIRALHVIREADVRPWPRLRVWLAASFP